MNIKDTLGHIFKAIDDVFIQAGSVHMPILLLENIKEEFPIKVSEIDNVIEYYKWIITKDYDDISELRPFGENLQGMITEVLQMEKKGKIRLNKYESKLEELGHSNPQLGGLTILEDMQRVGEAIKRTNGLNDEQVINELEKKGYKRNELDTLDPNQRRIYLTEEFD